MTITFPTNTSEIIDEIRSAVGRDVIFYTKETITCSACSLDPINNTSTNYACPICSGLYYIPTYSGVTISGHITWGHNDQMGWVSGGKLEEGDCRVQIKYTVSNLQTLDTTSYVDVDSKKMKIVNRSLRGSRNLNRIVLSCVELAESV